MFVYMISFHVLYFFYFRVLWSNSASDVDVENQFNVTDLVIAGMLKSNTFNQEADLQRHVPVCEYKTFWMS